MPSLSVRAGWAAAQMKANPLLWLAILFVCSATAGAQTADITLRQLNHRVFAATDGAPADIVALAQTTDGTLWIGGRTGLARFDGMRFVPYPGPSEEPLRQTNISALFAAPDGSLWIGFRPSGAAVLKHGRVTRYGKADGVPDGAVQQFALDPDGALWVAARLGVARLEGGQWTKVAGEPQLNTPYGVLVDRVGTLWVATVDGLRARRVDEDRFREVDRRVYFGPRGLLLTEAPDGRIWAAAGHELVRLDPMQIEVDGVLTLPDMSGGPLLFDAKGDLWTADPQKRELLRIAFEDLTRPDGRGVIDPQRFTRADGLSAGRVYALLEDRERNVWVATNTALHRFSRSNVVRDTVPPCAELGLQPPAFAAGDAGALWVVCDNVSEGHLNEIRDGQVVSRRISPPFSVAYRDGDGTVWFGGATTLARVEDDRIVVTEELPAHVRGRPLQALLSDGSGGMWVSVTRRGTFHVVGGKWVENGNLALPAEPAYVQIADESGVLWFGYTNSRIARINGRDVQLFDAKQGLHVGNVLSMLAEDGALWVGGELGFGRFDGKHFVPILHPSGQSYEGVSGIVRSRDGDLWLNGIAGISRIARGEIEQLQRDPAHRATSETFNYLDGVPGTAVQLRPQPSAIETTDGRIWFSMTGGIVSIDPTQLARNTLPPPVTIWSVASGTEHFATGGSALRLPVHTTALQIGYSAGSLSVPERVQFRYRLEGLDRNWHDAGNRREAHYTNLGPGNYTFRVIASNNDGVWNETGAALAFTIAPAFYQTRWFHALCALACVAILAALYRVRVQRVALQVRERLEARLAERERIARDLHDTLLQGMQGLIWRFQAAANDMPANTPTRQLIEQSLDRADKLLGESRDKVKDLRPAEDDVIEIAQALAAEGEQLAQLHQAKFRASVQGAPRDLHPIVREEGFLIGREALTNAFRHAGAASIEAEVAYGDGVLHLRVRDDGQGIDATVLHAGGRPGHFGLVGMRERARKLGAHLEVWSKPGAGTEVELRVPANVAYRPPQLEPSRGSRAWLGLFSSAREH
jgi:signal transduction histidine kinase/ligand-binding sensor domain-containing protein